MLLLFKLNPYLAGVLPGGGKNETEPKRAIALGSLEVLVVRQSDRSPVSGATIRIEGLSGKRHSMTSSREGKAVFNELLHEPHRVTSEGAGSSGTAWSNTGEVVEISLGIRPKRNGRVHDQDGNARPGIVHLLDRNARILASTSTDADGRYELVDLPEGVAVCAWPRNGAPASSGSGDIIVDEGEPCVETEPCDVFAMVPDSAEDKMVPLRARIFGEGRLPRGARAWVFEGDSARGASGVRPAGSSEFPGYCPGPKGAVVDSAGKAVAGARVEAHAMYEGARVVPNPKPQFVFTDNDGQFEFDSVSVGRKEFRVSAPGFATVIAPHADGVVQITLPRGYSVGGRVVDKDGNGVRGVRIDALPTPDPKARLEEGRTVTTDDGRFFLSGLGGTHVRVRASKRGYVAITMDHVPPNGFVTMRLKKRARND